jgi:hypothetical protein
MSYEQMKRITLFTLIGGALAFGALVLPTIVETVSLTWR